MHNINKLNNWMENRVNCQVYYQIYNLYIQEYVNININITKHNNNNNR